MIDYHNHLDALDPVDVLRIMDACGIERIVNITMKTGDEAIEMIRQVSFRRCCALCHHRLDGLVRGGRR